MEAQRFESLLGEKTKEIEEIIARFLPREEGYGKTVAEAMNYSVLAGGKRLRPMLMLETYRMMGGTGREIEPFLAAIEMIHTYSLIHDDLPAMDNDEYRRGRLTTWKVYGQAVGVLAGDGLLNLAFETMADALYGLQEERMKNPAAGSDSQAEFTERTCRYVRAMRLIAGRSGIDGMIGGQTADVEAEGLADRISMDRLLYIHEHKTAALIQAAMGAGAILAGASDEELGKIETCARDIGIAFQIQDDILDVEGDSALLGKPVGSDEENMKQTYVTLCGLEKAREDVERMSGEASDILKTFRGEHEFLEQLIATLIHRRK